MFEKIIFGMSCFLFAAHANATDVQIVNQIEHVVVSASGKSQVIVLDQYELSTKAQQALRNHVNRNRRLNLAPAEPEPDFLPESIQLGMNHIPVLTQGKHGTCVTFAVTAAIDATLNRGLYTSQLCLLRLGQYLHRTNWLPSGWKGYRGAILLFDRIKQHGIISLENQQRYGCGEVFDYPTRAFIPSGEMSLSDYNLYHEMLSTDQITWSFLWSVYGAPFETDAIVKIKTALSKGNRIVVSLILPRIYLGVAGATGRHHFPDDTWVLTPEIENSIDKTVSGHTMVLTGYDDKAVAVDRNGHLHHGLFTLRNSWGPDVGDEGNFYVSYDYFEGMVTEAIQIGQPAENLTVASPLAIE